MQVTVPRPDVKGRTEILNWYLSKIKVDPGRSGCKVFNNIKDISNYLFFFLLLSFSAGAKPEKKPVFAIFLNDAIVFDHLYKHCWFFPSR